MTRHGLNPDSLSDFAPRSKAAPESSSTRAQPSETERPARTQWERREAPQEGQFTIRANLDTIARFKAMCRPKGGGRFTYGEMLERLMDQAEGKP